MAVTRAVAERLVDVGARQAKELKTPGVAKEALSSAVAATGLGISSGPAVGVGAVASGGASSYATTSIGLFRVGDALQTDADRYADRWRGRREVAASLLSGAGLTSSVVAVGAVSGAPAPVLASSASSGGFLSLLLAVWSQIG